MNIAKTITELRKENDLSQEAFAEMLGVSRQSVSKWESGASVPDVDKIILMSRLFNVSTDKLLGVFDASEADTMEIPIGELCLEEALQEQPLTDNIEASENAEATETDSKKKHGSKGFIIKLIATVLVVCLMITTTAFSVYHGGICEAWWALNGGMVQYPYILVHGLGGWGEGDGINSSAQYWGATTGDLVSYLEEQGYSVYAPSVGPVSSAWDRACELYAQLTGTRVDYGEAHSKEHEHSRYGRTYSTPIVENWGKKVNGGQRIKINLVGHSFGGATVRLLTSLLEYGDEAEVAATGEDTSALFTGKKGNWVNSVTALCAPHNGSSLISVLDGIGSNIGLNAVETLSSLLFGIGDIASPASDIYDFKLDQFGIGNGNQKQTRSILSSFFKDGKDNALYDLSPDGASKLNETVKAVKKVYYFSYSYCTTQQGSLLKGQVPLNSTLPILKPTALAMGSYSGVTPGGINIDETWQPNDGLVSVISAKAPFDEESIEWTDEVKRIKRGVWYVAPTKIGDHGTVIGLNSETETTRNFYVELFNTVDNLRRW